MTTTQATWTKGRNGDWLVRTAAGLTGQTIAVAKKSGGSSTVTLARQIWAGEGVALYTTTTAATTGQSNGKGRNWDPGRFNGYGRPTGGYRRACKTDGNCSSFGSGRSCGGWDCDGF